MIGELKKTMQNMKQKKTKKPVQFDRDLHTILLFPKVSWSSLSKFGYEGNMKYAKRSEWYERYVLGKRQTDPSPFMIAGTVIGERLVADKKFLPEVPRFPVFEQELRGTIWNIELVGHLDGFGLDQKLLGEYKTSSNPKTWTQETVDHHDQILFYCLLIWLNYKIRPEDLKITLTYIPCKLVTKDGVKKTLITMNDKEVVLTGEKAKTFRTKRTMRQVLEFQTKIKNAHAEMVKYIEARRLSDNR